MLGKEDLYLAISQMNNNRRASACERAASCERRARLHAWCALLTESRLRHARSEAHPDLRWLDASTRALLIKASFYNANLDSYVSSSFVFDFTLGGVVLPKVAGVGVGVGVGVGAGVRDRGWRPPCCSPEPPSPEPRAPQPRLLRTHLLPKVVFGTLRTISFDPEKEPTLFISDVGVYLLVLYYTLNQLWILTKTVRKTGSLYNYFKDIWNLVELFVLTLFYASVATRVRFFSSLYPDPMIFEPYFIDYHYVTAQYALSFNLDAVPTNLRSLPRALPLSSPLALLPTCSPAGRVQMEFQPS